MIDEPGSGGDEYPGIGSPAKPADRWEGASTYEEFMGRWSRPLAYEFIRWLGTDRSLSWLDVGCGTGALTSAILELAEPAAVLACDPSRPFVEHLRRRILDPRLEAVVAGAGSLPARPGGFDRVVSGLVLNFLPDPEASVEEMRSRTRPGGVVAAYVWDYADRMQFLRVFWDEAVALDPGARELDEGNRFPLCRPGRLESIFREAGLQEVRSGAVEVPTHFGSFADYWKPFLGGPGPAPSYVGTLSDDNRAALRARLEERLAAREGGIELSALAWCVSGIAA